MKRTTVEWLLNAMTEAKSGVDRKKGPLWQTVLLLDLKKGKNTLTFQQCEPTKILGIKMQPIQTQ